MKEKKRKIFYVASSGGHMEELAQLKTLVKENDVIVTEKSDYTVADWCPKVYYVKQINRKERTFLLKFIFLFVRSFILLCKENPNVIISTGALATFPVCCLAKLMGKKIIYIESFARVDEGSMTGKLMYHIADLFIVQWKELLKVFPNAVYGGSIF